MKINLNIKSMFIKSFTRIIFFLLFICINVSCNLKNNAKESHNIYCKNDRRVTTEEVFLKLKNKDYRHSDSLADIGIDSINSFFILLHSLSEIGIDSIDNALIYLYEFKKYDSSKCSQLLANETIEFLLSEGVDVESRRIFLSYLLDSLEYENLEKACLLFNVTNETYTLTVQEDN